MRFQIILALLLASLSLHAKDDKSMNELFKKYDLLMDQKKVELVDDVFTQKFLRDSGGKEEFIAKVKAMPVEKQVTASKVSWRKGVKNQMFLAKVQTTEFIIVVENGKLKINGTAGDAD